MEPVPETFLHEQPFAGNLSKTFKLCLHLEPLPEPSPKLADAQACSCWGNLRKRLCMRLHGLTSRAGTSVL